MGNSPPPPTAGCWPATAAYDDDAEDEAREPFDAFEDSDEVDADEEDEEDRVGETPEN